MAACVSRNAAVIVDEVFWDYPFETAMPEASPFTTPQCLLFRLGGESKPLEQLRALVCKVALHNSARRI